MLSLCRLRMLLEVACRLDVLLSADLALWQHVAIFLDVASLLPVAEHHSHVALAVRWCISSVSLAWAKESGFTA